MTSLNLGILAHVDAGKTTLTEQLLHAAGVIDDVGRVDTGTTTTDSLELERQRGITIKSAVASFDVDGVTINLVDTPGHPDFIAEVERVLGVLDGAVLVVSAVEGVQSQTLLLFRALRRLGVPTLIFLNKLDRVGADVPRTLDAIEARLGATPVPMGEPSGVGTRGVTVLPLDLSVQADSEAIAEALALSDDDLMRRVLARDAIGRAEIEVALARQTSALLVQPVFFGAALHGTGAEELLGALPRFLPCAAGSDEGMPAGAVFKIDRGHGGEKIAFVRLFSGTLSIRDRVQLGDDVDTVTGIEVFTQGTTARRNSMTAGQIARVRGLRSAHVGATFGDTGRPAVGEVFAAPTLETAIVAHDPADQRAVYDALADLAEQDPLINLRQDDARHEMFLSLYGEVQKEIIALTLLGDHGLAIDFRQTTPVCIERPHGRGRAIERIPRGRRPNHPFLATIGLQVEPLPVGSGVEFHLDVGVKSIPIHVFDSVDVFEDVMRAAVLDTLEQGRFGWRVTDISVTMTDCDYQAPPRRWPGTTLSDYRDLTPMVLMAALEDAGTTVCEPVLDLRLEFPDDVLGSILALLRDVEARPGAPAQDGPVWVLDASVRAARLHHLQSRLPDLTRGEGVLENCSAGYEPVRGDPPSRPRTGIDPRDRTEYLRAHSG